MRMADKCIMKNILVFSLFLVLLSSFSFALSNESIQAKSLIDEAFKDIEDMQLRNISILRANESLQESLQLYEVQLAFEESGKKADYDLVVYYASQASEIKEKALTAYDELAVFKEFFNKADIRVNLSEMDDDYGGILNSFLEERYEDTLILIDKGYERMSEIEASHTTLNLFYKTTSNTIRNFFAENWLNIIIFFTIILIFSIIFRKTLKRFRVKVRLNNLKNQKVSLNGLIKRVQSDYFKSKKISAGEYDVKLTKFKEMSRDIERQIFLMREESMKVGRYKKAKVKVKKRRFKK